MGDNPRTYGGRNADARLCCITLQLQLTTNLLLCGAVNEIQEITCHADNGTFMLAFRENVTTPIYWNTTVAQFKLQLEQLYT